MQWMRAPLTIPGQFISATMMVSILAAGCPSDGLFAEDGFGTIINTDTSKDLVGGVRLKSGQAVYSYGSFLADGSVGEVTSIVFQDTSGGLATLYLESGRPSRLIAPDGTRMQIIYEEVSTQRLAGTISITPAGQSEQTYAFDVDLQKTAQDIATLVKNELGITITTETPPADSTSKAVADLGTPTPVAPSQKATSAVDRDVLVVVVPAVLVVTGFTLNLVMSQILSAMLRVADAVAKSFIVAILTPFIFMGNVMRFAIGQPLVEINYTPDLIQNELEVVIPRPQTF